MLTSTKPLKDASCLQVYLLGAIDAFDDTHFEMDGEVFFRHSLDQNKDEPLTAVAAYRYDQDARGAKVRNQVLPFFPKDLVSTKSGRGGFRETCNEVCINAHRKGLVKKTLKRKLTKWFHPPLWEYTKAPWYFGLLIKSFRRDPQLAMQVADVMNDKTNLPNSQADIKRQKQVGNVAARVQIPLVPTSIVPTYRAAAASDSSSAGGIYVSRSCHRSSKRNCNVPRLLPPRH